jgi:HPt (histidine-containing phosphotransfer) domain-containing protein
MNDKINSGPFVFHNTIDSESLTALYDNDYAWIEEVFGTVLATFDQDAAQIRNSLEGNDVEALRKAVHKMKPSFGFVGMNQVQQMCQQFEDHCKNASSVSEVKGDGLKLIELISSSRFILENELNRLKEYNK